MPIGEKYVIDFPPSAGKSNEQILCDLCDSVVKSKNKSFEPYGTIIVSPGSSSMFCSRFSPDITLL